MYWSQLYAILPPIIHISTFHSPACTTCYNPSSGEKGDGAHTPSQVSHLAHPEVSRGTILYPDPTLWSRNHPLVCSLAKPLFPEPLLSSVCVDGELVRWVCLL